MTVDLHLTAACGCFVTSLSGRANIAPCAVHSARLLVAFDRPPDQIDAVLAAVYDRPDTPTHADPERP